MGYDVLIHGTVELVHTESLHPVNHVAGRAHTGLWGQAAHNSQCRHWPCRWAMTQIRPLVTGVVRIVTRSRKNENTNNADIRLA